MSRLPELRGALLDAAVRQGASVGDAVRRGASVDDAVRCGASVNDAVHRGASVNDAVRQGTPGYASDVSPRGATAALASAHARRTIRQARRLPALGLALLALGLSAAVALAASGLIQTGAPVKSPPGERFTPTSGYGVPIAKTVRLLAISVPDPAGGPPWGLRYLRTTRGLGCVQLGRLVGGRLGVLGRDGSFADDGRFHELPPDVFEPLHCAPLDARGHAFLALAFSALDGLPASGAQSGLGLHGCLPADARMRTVSAGASACPATDDRLVSYGLLGPDARSLTYRVGDETRTIPVKGPLGAYLVVQPGSEARRRPGSPIPPASGGVGRLTAVAYTDGIVCHLAPANSPGGASGCPFVGFARGHPRQLSHEQLATRVTVSIGLGIDSADACPSRRWGRLVARTVDLAFRARVGVFNASSRYMVELRPPAHAPCAAYEHYARLYPVEHDVAVGEVVHVRLPLTPACRKGTWSGRVVYLTGADAGGPLPLSVLRGAHQALDPKHGTRAPLVGRFSFTLR